MIKRKVLLVTTILTCLLFSISCNSFAKAATTVSLSVSTTTTDSINVYWSKSGDLLFTRYEVYMKEATAGSYTKQADITNIDTTSYTADGLTADTEYYFYVKDVDTLGSADSNTVTATTEELPPLVDFEAFDYLVYKDILAPSLFEFSFQPNFTSYDVPSLFTVVPDFGLDFEIGAPTVVGALGFNSGSGGDTVDAAIGIKDGYMEVTLDADASVSLAGGIIDTINSGLVALGPGYSAINFTYGGQVDYFNRAIFGGLGVQELIFDPISFDIAGTEGSTYYDLGVLGKWGLEGTVSVVISPMMLVQIELENVDISISGDAVADPGLIESNINMSDNSAIEFTIDLADGDLAGKTISADFEGATYIYTFLQAGVYVGFTMSLQAWTGIALGGPIAVGFWADLNPMNGVSFQLFGANIPNPGTVVNLDPGFIPLNILLVDQLPRAAAETIDDANAKGTNTNVAMSVEYVFPSPDAADDDDGDESGGIAGFDLLTLFAASALSLVYIRIRINKKKR